MMIHYICINTTCDCASIIDVAAKLDKPTVMATFIFLKIAVALNALD